MARGTQKQNEYDWQTESRQSIYLFFSPLQSNICDLCVEDLFNWAHWFSPHQSRSGYSSSVTYRAILRVYMALLRVYRALLRVYKVTQGILQSVEEYSLWLTGLFCLYIWLFCMYTGLFCVYTGPFCLYTKSHRLFFNQLKNNLFDVLDLKRV